MAMRGRTQRPAQSDHPRRWPQPHRPGSNSTIAVHAAYALADAGFEAIMVNCNPETVSTDYDTSDRLYFEPHRRGCRRTFPCRAAPWHIGRCDCAVWWSDAAKIGKPWRPRKSPSSAPRPTPSTWPKTARAFKNFCANSIFANPRMAPPPAAKRPNGWLRKSAIRWSFGKSYVLGGQAMEIVHDVDQLRRYMTTAVQASGDNPVLIDSFESRHRNRRRRDQRRRGGRNRRHHGTYRRSRHPFRRQHLFLAAPIAGRGDPGQLAPANRTIGPGSQRRRPDEHSIRD